MQRLTCGLARLFSAFPAPVWLAAVLFLCIGFSSGVILPFLALWVEHSAQVPARFVGPLLACYSAGELLATPFLGGIADRRGRRPVLIVSLAGVGLGFALLPACQGAFWVALTLLSIGIFESVLHPTVFTVIADVVAPERSRQAFALVRGFAGMGRIIGPAVGTLLVSQAHGAVFYGAAAASLLGSLIALIAVPETRPIAVAGEQGDEDDEEGLSALWPAFRDRHLAALLLGLLILEICAGWVPSVLPLYSHDHGSLDVRQVGWLFTYGAALTVALQWLTARRLARVGSVRLVVASTLMLVLAFAAMLALPGVAGLVIGMTMLSGNQMVLGPLVPATMSALAPAHQRAGYMAAASVCNDLEDTLGPAIGTLLYGSSPRLPWLLGMPLALLAGSFLGHRLRQPRDEQAVADARPMTD